MGEMAAGAMAGIAPRRVRQYTRRMSSSGRRSGLRAVLLLATARLISCHHEESIRNVVLITVDTMRADHTGLYGYQRATTPNLDRWFGKQGRTYLKSWSTEAATTPSIISILTGLLPQQHRVRMLIQLVPPELKLLPQMLPPGFQTAGIVSNMMLTREASGLGPQFEYFDDFVDERERYRGDTYERNAERTTDAVLKWLDGRKERDSATGTKEATRPLFLWVHYMDPHGPYHPPDNWKRSFTHPSPLPIDITRILSYQREPGVTDGLAYVDAYDEELAYVDAQVGRLLDGIAAQLPLEQTLFVFTADHGESLMDHEAWFRHAVQVYDDIVRVPLMLRGPGVVPGRSSMPSSGIDIAPTILKALGLPVVPPMPDVDLRNEAGMSPTRVLYTEASLSARDGGEQWRAAIQNGTKWVIGARKGNCGVSQRRYDLERDPAELVIKPWTGEGEAPQSLLRLCREDPDPAGIPAAWAFGATLKGPKSPPMSGEDQLRSLKALGYAD